MQAKVFPRNTIDRVAGIIHINNCIGRLNQDILGQYDRGAGIIKINRAAGANIAMQSNSRAGVGDNQRGQRCGLTDRPQSYRAGIGA